MEVSFLRLDVRGKATATATALRMKLFRVLNVSVRGRLKKGTTREGEKQSACHGFDALLRREVARRKIATPKGLRDTTWMGSVREEAESRVCVTAILAVEDSIVSQGVILWSPVWSVGDLPF